MLFFTQEETKLTIEEYKRVKKKIKERFCSKTEGIK